MGIYGLTYSLYHPRGHEQLSECQKLRMNNSQNVSEVEDEQ